MVNVPLLRKTMEHIDSIPEIPAPALQDFVWSEHRLPEFAGQKEGWFQGDWLIEGSCGTAGCFAGHAVLIDGAQIHTDKISLLANDDDPATATFQDAEGTQLVEVSERAQRILGLSDEEADDLFAAENSKDTLREVVERLIAQNEEED